MRKSVTLYGVRHDIIDDIPVYLGRAIVDLETLDFDIEASSAYDFSINELTQGRPFDNRHEFIFDPVRGLTEVRMVIRVEEEKVMQENSNDYQVRAKELVYELAKSTLDKSDQPINFGLHNVYVVWFAKTLGNWKALVSTDLPDGRYYEVTHNGATQQEYVDVYVKVFNKAVDSATQAPDAF